MTVRVNKSATTLVDATSKQAPAKSEELFWFTGDSTETDFVLAAGWVPKYAYVDGALMREGSSDDYTVKYNGYVYTVVFAVAPAAVDVGIIAVRT